MGGPRSIDSAALMSATRANDRSVGERTRGITRAIARAKRRARMARIMLGRGFVRLACCWTMAWSGAGG
jgi:hypothetical protein